MTFSFRGGPRPCGCGRKVDIHQRWLPMDILTREGLAGRDELDSLQSFSGTYSSSGWHMSFSSR